MIGGSKQSNGLQPRDAKALLPGNSVTLCAIAWVGAKGKLFFKLRLPLASQLKVRLAGGCPQIVPGHFPSVTRLSALPGLRAPVTGAYRRDVFDAIRSANRRVTRRETGVSNAATAEAGSDKPASFIVDLDRRRDVLNRLMPRHSTLRGDLSLAKAAMRRFFSVGTRDHPARGVQRLNQNLAPFAMSLNRDEIRRDNARDDQCRQHTKFPFLSRFPLKFEPGSGRFRRAQMGQG